MNQIKNKLRSLRLLAAATTLLAALPAWAVDPFTVRDIRVEGLQRVEPGTVFASLPFRIGEQYNDDKGSNAIRSLFNLGLFSDVRIQINGDVLVVIVEERPTVADLSFSGIKEFDAELLKKSLRDVGLSEGRPYDKALADRAEQELKRQYINRSMYGAQVVTTVTPTDRNRVNLNFSVVEGDVAKIKEIRVVGNKAYDESTLRGLFDLDTGGWLSWYTKSDRYSRAKLNADLETLRSYYLTRGYLEFRIDSTQVAISPDKQTMSVTINVTEGNRFVVSSVKLEGEYLGKQEEFKSLVKMRAGEAYNAEDVTRTVKAFTDYFGAFGYAFAQVDAAPVIDRANGQVSFVLRAQPARRVYVRRINVEGNNRTRDEVIRREFRQLSSPPGTTATASASRATGWIAWAISPKWASPPNPCRAPMTRSTSRDHGGGKAHWKPLDRRCRLFAGRQAVPDRQHQAGKRVWQRQLPGVGHEHQQVQPPAGAQHHQPVLHPGRHLPHLRLLLQDHASVRRTGRRLPDRHARCGGAFWRAFH